MKTILGTGQIGMTVMETLLRINPNEQLLLVNRSGKVKASLPENVQIMTGDATDKNQMETIARNSEIIFSCTDMPYQQWNEFYPSTAAALAHALNKSDTKLIVADNLYSYGNLHGSVMKEDNAHTAQTKKGGIRAAMINTLLASGKEFNKRVAFVKAADFIGPSVHKGIFGIDFLGKVYRGEMNLMAGNIVLPHTFTYVPDFATALVNVANASDGFGQIWHAPNASAMGMDKWIHLFEVATGKNIKRVVLPKSAIRFAGLFNSLVKEFHELAYQFEYPYLVDHSKYASRFGDHSTSPSIVVKATVKWYNSQMNKNENI